MKKFSVNPLVLDPDESFDFEVSDCDFSTPLIVDGEKTKPGEFPQMAVLGWGSQYGRDVGKKVMNMASAERGSPSTGVTHLSGVHYIYLLASHFNYLFATCNPYLIRRI